MTLWWAARFVAVWLIALLHGASDCARVWDMDPGLPLPGGKTYEEWYGSPALLCTKSPLRHHAAIYCIGPNC